MRSERKVQSNFGDRTECRKTKCRGQNVADIWLWTKCRGQMVAKKTSHGQMVARTKCCMDKMLHGQNVARTDSCKDRTSQDITLQL